MAYAIETDDLSRSFGNVVALDGLRLRVPAGKIFGYLGPNGAGKTTTLHLLLGVLAPSRGTASVAGIDVAQRPSDVRRRCGALLEHNGLYERLSAEENLEFQGRIHGLALADRKARTKELLDGLGLWDRRRERVEHWSRGMKQQLAIARALYNRPSVLFLDEPTAGFDPGAAARLRKDLQAMVRATGTTVFLTTHNLHEAEEVCSQVAVIRSGRLVAAGDPSLLRKQRGAPKLLVTGIGLTAARVAALARRTDVASAVMDGGALRVEVVEGTSTAPIIAALVKAGVAVEEARLERESLESSFLAILEGS